MASEDRFGYEWHHYSELNPIYEEQFRRWVHPLTESDFAGKKVLDAGCGMGRNSYWALKWGASSLTAFDFDKRSVAAATKTLESYKNAEVKFSSVYDISWEDEYDLAFSIGVIHHLKEPEKAIDKIADALKPGGTLLIWVYGYESNEWIVKIVNPVRKLITSKLPVALVHVLSYFCSIPLFIFVKIFRGPGKYLKLLSTFSLRHIHSIVFDQLIPEVANYWRKDEAYALFDGNDKLENVRISHTNGNSWTVIATKK